MSAMTTEQELKDITERLMDLRLDLELVRQALRPAGPLLMPTERGEGEAGAAIVDHAIHSIEAALDDLGELQDLLKK